MSFFYDFLDYFKVDDLSDKVLITTVLGVGVMIVGKVKIENLSEELIELKTKKEKITINGTDLKFKTISRGEIVLSGKVFKIETGELWKIWSI